MRARVAQALDGIGGGGFRLAAMCALLFLVMVGIVFGRSGRDAIFIREIGSAKLPFMYLLTAVVMVGASGLYARVVDRMSRFRLLAVVLLAEVAVIALLRLLMILPHSAVAVAVFCVTEVLLIIPPMHFWTYGNDVFNPREGKRAFPIIGAAGMLGTVAGGLLTRAIAQNAGTPELFTAWALAGCLCLPAALAARPAKRDGNMRYAKDEKRDGPPAGRIGEVRELLSIPLVRTLALLHVPMYIVIYVIDYQFFSNLNEVFPDRDAMAGFLGVFTAVWSGSAMAFQFLLAGPLLRRFGVGRVALVHPISVSLGAGALVARSLIALPVSGVGGFRSLLAVFSKYSHISVKYGIDEPAYNLLFNSISRDRRGRSRALITGTVKPLCVALSGLFIIVMIDALGADIRLLSIATVALCAVWLVMSLRIQREYLQAMVANLESKNVELRDAAERQLTRSDIAGSRDRLLRDVDSDDDAVAVYACRLLADIMDEGVARRLAARLPAVRDRVKRAILSSIAGVRERDVVDAVMRAAGGSDPAVAAAALQALGRMGDPGVLPFVERFLDAGDPMLQGEAIVACLMIDPVRDPESGPMRALRSLAQSDDPRLRLRAAASIRAAGGRDLVPILLRLSESGDEAVRCEVIGALGETHDERAVPVLLEAAEDRRMRPYAFDALRRLGPIATSVVHAALDEGGMPRARCVALASLLGHIGNPRSIPVLLGLLDDRPLPVQYAAIGSIAAIKAALMAQEGVTEFIIMQLHFPADVRETVLERLSGFVVDVALDREHVAQLRALGGGPPALIVDALERWSRRRIETCMQCLSIATDAMTVSTAARRLRSRDRRVRAEAVEVIEGLCAEARGLARIIESSWREEQPAHAAEAARLFRELMMKPDGDEWYRACVAFAAGRLRLGGLSGELESIAGGEGARARVLAAWALRETGRPLAGGPDDKEMDAMNADMERILFLRSVPLFEEIEGGELRWISEIAAEETFFSGDIVFREGEEGDALYVIMHGSVKIVKGGQPPVTLCVLEERDYFGEMAILDEDVRSATVEVDRDARFLVIRREHFRTLLEARPQIAFAVFRTFSARLRDLQRQIVEGHAASRVEIK